MNHEDLSKLEPHPLAALFPMIDGTDYGALVEDIRLHGVREPITLYQGKILDGRNRVKAAIDCDKTVNTIDFTGTEDEARAYVMSLNLHRRHLTAEQRRELIKAELLADPTQSDRAIAEKVKGNKNTVAVQREQLEATGQIDQLTKRTGKDGKARAAKPKRPPIPSGAGKAIDLHNKQKAVERAAAKAQATAAVPTQEPGSHARHEWTCAVNAFRMAVKDAKAAGLDVRPAINELADDADEVGAANAAHLTAQVTH